MKTRQQKAIEKAADWGKGIKYVTRGELVDLLLAQEAKGANFVEVFAKTVPSMRKTNNPYVDRIVKVAEKNAQINWFYENAVQNQRTREEIFDDFTPESRKWGSFIDNPHIGKTSKTVLEHTNKSGEYCQYVQMRTLETRSVSYEYIEDGRELTAEEIRELETFFPPYRQAATQGTEKPIVVNDYKIGSIEMLSMNNVLYVVTGD